MEIYKDVHIDDEMLLGGMREVSKEFGKPFHEIEWDTMDGDITIRLISALVRAVKDQPLSKAEVDDLVSKIPMHAIPGVFEKLTATFPGTKKSAKHKDGNLQEGNVRKQASKTSTVPSQ